MKTLTTLSVAGFAAGVLLSGSAFAAGLSTAFADAGVEKGSVAYHKILSSLNISNFNLDEHEGKMSTFKLCKRRWLSSPAGAYTGLTVEGELKTTESTGEEQDPVETTGTFSETLENVREGAFDMKFMVKMGDQDKQEGVMKVTRAEYIVTCQEIMESIRELEKDLLLVTRYGEPQLLNVKTESESYQTIAHVQSQSGLFANGGTFEVQKFTADANFGVYRKALVRTDLMVMANEEGKVESIMAMSSKVNKVSVAGN